MDDRIDVSALALDDGERELLVAVIMARAASELARRAAEDVSPITVLYEWARPALAAAAVLAVVCLSVLTRHDVLHAAGPGTGLTEALAVPAPVSAWLVGDRSPSLADVMLAVEGE
jgi:hypothetical protein